MQVRRKLGLGITLMAGVLFVSVSVAQGILYDPNGLGGADYKKYVKFQADVGKQVGKLSACLTKALGKCLAEVDPNIMAPPVPSGQCSVEDPNNSVGVDAETLAKFVEAVDKCFSKLDFTKKQPDGLSSGDAYAALGCPAEPDSEWPGENKFYDMPTYQGAVEASAKFQVDMTAVVLPMLCAAEPTVTDGVGTMECVNTLTKAASSFIKGVFKCIGKCESDLKGTKGGGALTDDPNGCLVNYKPVQEECMQKVREKIDKKVAGNPAAKNVWVVMGALVEGILATTQDTYYNKTPWVSPAPDCFAPCPDPNTCP